MKTTVILFILFLLPAAQIYAQLETEEGFNEQAGIALTMAESGSGVGGFYSLSVFKDIQLGAGLDVYFIRDSKEISVPISYTSQYPIYVTLNKVNNVYLFDLTVFFKYRMFVNTMDESFRPFISAGAGPIYGINYPEVEFAPEKKDEFAWAMGGVIGIGADINVSGPKAFLGIKAQYRFIPFKENIGERENHSMFELRFEIGGRF